MPADDDNADDRAPADTSGAPSWTFYDWRCTCGFVVSAITIEAVTAGISDHIEYAQHPLVVGEDKPCR